MKGGADEKAMVISRFVVTDVQRQEASIVMDMLRKFAWEVEMSNVNLMAR